MPNSLARSTVSGSNPTISGYRSYSEKNHDCLTNLPSLRGSRDGWSM